MTTLTYPLIQEVNYIPKPRTELGTQNSYPMWRGTPTRTHTTLKTHPHTKYRKAEGTPSSYHTNNSNPALMHNNVCITFCNIDFSRIYIVTLSLWLHSCGGISVSHSITYHVPTNGHHAATNVYCSAVHSPATT
jgi:hypothetical protein